MYRFTAGMLACLAAIALAPAAQAQVVIETAPGAEGASMEPTGYLNAETARILPAHLQYVSLGAGYGPIAAGFGTVGSLLYNRGMGAGGELQFAVAPSWLGATVATPAGMGWNFALGYKQRMAVAGAWDLALHGDASYTPFGYGLLLDLPSTAQWGPGDLTLAPRAVLPDLAHGLNASVYGVMASYRLPLGDRWRLLGELAGGFHSGGTPAYEAKLGARFCPLPTFDVDAGLGFDLLGLGMHPAHPENSLASLAVRFGF